MFHKAFKRWLNDNQQKLGVGRLHVTGRKRDSLLLRFIGYPDCLSVSISPAEISVAVSLEGQFIDYLLCLDMSSPVMKGKQVFCESCRPESRILYPSLEAYWQGHQFAPFGDWLTNKLVPGKWLGIYRNWAELTMDESKGDELIKAVQLR